MSQYLFVFGRTPVLAKLELKTFFPKIKNISEDLALFETNETLDPKEIINQLGGTVKIALVKDKSAEINPESFVKVLKNTPNQKITFGISSYISDFLITERLLSAVKNGLEDEGFSVRFVKSKEGGSLSSVVIEKQKIQELILVKEDKLNLIAETSAVQPFEEWNKRDYRRPFADPHAGMLPPKVARMLVNIASNQINPISQIGLIWEKTLLDPFCGMGTILAEALLTGWEVIGSDYSEEVVRKVKKNLEWLQDLYPPLKEHHLKVLVSEAAHISERLSANSVDTIVTEPFMGALREGGINQLNQSKKIKNIIKGLEKLYIGCLKDWKKVLKPEGKVVIALPEYVADNRTFFVKKVIDNCEILGYTVQTGPIEYSRPQAVVRRKFFVLTKLV